MTMLISQQELDQLSEQELRQKYQAILEDLIRRGRSAQDCPLSMLTLLNIRKAIQRKRASMPRVPGD